MKMFFQEGPRSFGGALTIGLESQQHGDLLWHLSSGARHMLDFGLLRLSLNGFLQSDYLMVLGSNLLRGLVFLLGAGGAHDSLDGSSAGKLCLNAQAPN